MRVENLYMKKLVATCVMLGLIFLTGCGYSAEEKAQRRAYEKQAKENAVEYVKQKYGFEPIGKSAYCKNASSGPIPNISPNPSGDVYVTLQYDKTVFSVYIAGDEETTDGIDNYQLSEVTEAVEDYLKTLTDSSAEEISLCYGAFLSNSITRDGNGMVETYFDGTNLKEVLTENKLRIALSYIDADLSEVNTEEMKQTLGEGAYLLMSYRSLDDYENYGKIDYSQKSSLGSGLNEMGMYLREYYYFDVCNELYQQFNKTSS